MIEKTFLGYVVHRKTKRAAFITGKYEDDSTAIQLYEVPTMRSAMRWPQGMAWEPPYAKVTVCLAEYGHKPPDGWVFIKTWGEGENMLESLINARIVEDFGFRIPVNVFGSEAALCKLNKPAD